MGSSRSHHVLCRKCASIRASLPLRINDKQKCLFLFLKVCTSFVVVSEKYIEQIHKRYHRIPLNFPQIFSFLLQFLLPFVLLLLFLLFFRSKICLLTNIHLCRRVSDITNFTLSISGNKTTTFLSNIIRASCETKKERLSYRKNVHRRICMKAITFLLHAFLSMSFSVTFFVYSLPLPK